MASGDHLFRSQLRCRAIIAACSPTPPAQRPLEMTPRAPTHVQVLGVNPRPHGTSPINRPQTMPSPPIPSSLKLSRSPNNSKANTGDTILLHVQKPSLLSRDAPIGSPQDRSIHCPPPESPSHRD